MRCFGLCYIFFDVHIACFVALIPYQYSQVHYVIAADTANITNRSLSTSNVPILIFAEKKCMKSELLAIH